MTLPILEDFIKLSEVWQLITKFIGIYCSFAINDAKNGIHNKILKHEEGMKVLK